MLIDDFQSTELISALGTRWRGVTDTVMGGVSRVTIRTEVVDGRRCLRMVGDVSLENNGGFVQASLELAVPPATLDASGYTGVRLVVRTESEEYGLHLRTTDGERPWQSYRSRFNSGPRWQELRLPFNSFRPHRLAEPLNLACLRRLGLIAIGRAFHADLAVAEIGLYV